MATVSVMKATKVALLGAYVLNMLGTQAGLTSGVFQGTRKAILNALSVAHLVRLAIEKKHIVRAALLLLGLIRVSPKPGHPSVSLFQMVARRILFGKASALPPVVPLDVLARHGREYGPWKRHLAAMENQEKYGDIFCIIRPFSSTDWSLAVPFIFVSDVEMVKTIMTDKKTYPTRGHTGFTSLVGDGLLGLETGEKWASHRRVVSKYLTEKHLKGYAKIIESQLDVFLDKWGRAADKGEIVNCYYDMSMLTLDVIMEIGTGERSVFTSQQLVPEAENDMSRDLDFALQEIVVRTASPLYDMLPSPRIEKIRKKLDDLFDALVKRAQEIPEDERPEASILHGLLSAKNDDGTPALSEKEVNEEFKTIRGAGHETTGNTICFMIKLLQENPDKLLKLQQEVDAVVAGPSPTYEEAKQLKYAHQVMYEALRMYPTVPQFPRVAAYDTKLGDFDVPAGSFVFVSQHSLNYNPQIWPEPHKFIPERFDQLPELQPTKPVGVPGDKKLEYAFLPFGAAHRTCVGQRLSLLEGVQIIGAIVKNFDFVLADPTKEVDVIADVTLGPKHGMPLSISRRTK